jgi:eukaryotic-like serine/threonine-protein kinase
MAIPELSTSNSSSAKTASLVDRLADEMVQRWHAGDSITVEELLAACPDLRGEPAAVMELLAEELNLREEFGRPADIGELRQRFSQWQQELEILLDCQNLLSGHVPAPQFPKAGEAIGGFRLLHELGRGAHGRVFLATQFALADRPVVLKLTPSAGGEHLALARLQHTNIVPLFSAHEFPDAGLRGLCLPHFGGATLAAVLDALRGRRPDLRTGRDIFAAIRPTARGLVAAPSNRFLEQATYAGAVCWIGACLADALAYAADRGLLHLDLKPSNVLLTAEGQPMLLDFHLARAPLRAGAAAPPWLGGTPNQMAPEHSAALAAVRGGLPIPMAVDERADVFGLGLLLMESLGLCEERFPTRVWRRANPHVSVGLADLLARCLASDPADRYPSATAVAIDLRRHIADLPLSGVRNRSPVERWQKWRKRRPFALPAAGLLCVATALGVGEWANVNRQAEQAGCALRASAEFNRDGRYAEAEEAAKVGAALADGLLFSTELATRLREERSRADAGLAARELENLCERVRPLYAVDNLPERSARAVESCCRDLWSRRQRLLEAVNISPDLTAAVRANLLDLAVLWADLKIRLAAPVHLAAAQEQALAVLDEAEQLFGPSCVVARMRQALAADLGQADLAEKAACQVSALHPRSAWEHYAFGRAALRAGDMTAASVEMSRALELQPQALWPNFYRGSCAFQTGQFEDAVTAFSVCVALAPDSAWCYFNRGLALAKRGRPDAARADFDHALRLDPELAPAALSRGTLALQAGRPSEALLDFRLALDHGANPAAVHHHLALAHLAGQDTTSARESLQRALEHNPAYQPALDLLNRMASNKRSN